MKHFNTNVTKVVDSIRGVWKQINKYTTFYSLDVYLVLLKGSQVKGYGESWSIF